MALAISFRSESSDHYVFAFDDFPEPLTVIDAIVKRLDTEVKHLYISAFDSNHEHRNDYHKIISDAVNNYISELHNE